MNAKVALVILSGVALLLLIGLQGADAQPRRISDDIEDLGFPELLTGDDDDDDDDGDDNFAANIAGTYVSTVGPFSGALVFHADGTLGAISNACCGNGFGGHIESEAFGNWVRTGPYQIELAGVLASTYYDEAHVPLPAGERNGVCIASERINFEPGFQSYTGELVTKCWLESPTLAAIFGGTGGPLPNVLDPEREPDLCTVDLVGGPIPIAGGRLPAVYPTCGDVP